ncbi:MAG: hypothetical protein ACRC6X_05935 [Culicoidibacterales bacterium]
MLNSAYFSTLGSFVPIRKIDVIKSVFKMIDTINPTGILIVITVFLLSFINQLINKEQRSKYFQLYLISFIALLINLYANSLAGVANMHYFMSFIPIFLLPCVHVFGQLHSYIENSSKKKVFANLSLVFIAILLSYTAFSVLSWNALNNVGQKSYETSQLDNYIRENTEASDYVQFFQGPAYITANYRNQRLSPSKYSYYAAGIFTEESKTTFATQIAEDNVKNNPRLIVFNSEATKKDFESHITNKAKWQQFLDRNYEKVSLNKNEIIFKRV